MTDLTFPTTRTKAAEALAISNSLVGRRLKELQEFHNPAALTTKGDRLTRYGFERIVEYGDLGKREYERRHSRRDAETDGGAGAGQLATRADAEIAPLGLRPDTSDLDPDFAPATQRQARYRDIASMNNEATAQRFAKLAQNNRHLIQSAMEEGRAMGQMLAAAQQQAMLAEYQRQNSDFGSKFSSINEGIDRGE
jgi:hypothetical protein